MATQQFAIVLSSYYGGEACNEKDHNFNNDTTEGQRRDHHCVKHDCPGQDLVLATTATHDEARTLLLVIARRICVKGWSYHNTFIEGIARDPRNPSKSEDFVMLEDSCLYGSSLSIIMDDPNALFRRMKLARGWCNDWPTCPEDAEVTAAGCTLMDPWCDVYDSLGRHNSWPIEPNAPKALKGRGHDSDVDNCH